MASKRESKGIEVFAKGKSAPLTRQPPQLDKKIGVFENKPENERSH